MNINVDVMYTINKFLFYQVDDNAVVIQTANGLTKIHDHRMIELLQVWEESFKKSVSQRSLEEIFKEDSNEATQYLLRYGIIELTKANLARINSVKVLSTNNNVNNLLFDTISNKYANALDVSRISSNDLINHNFENDFLIIFLDQYDKKLVKTLQQKLRHAPTTVSLMSYVYAKNLYLDCLYSTDWKIPCHNCHIGHIQSSFYLNDDEEATYQQLIDHLYSETNDEFIAGIPLNSVQELNAACLISNKVNAFLNDLHYLDGRFLHVEDINKCTLMDLSTFRKYEDTSLHWEMCDCYE